ncbi:reverse transcriptase domain-containing protein [Tanacetum coccineum]|uniref:Reverse transcriptase domain-containing protein n=1 Tax=Tanacetum coccineum TaxID=301880 RepID=A0ABQ5I2V8_9ASTR
MPFRLCNAPTTFQRCMTAIFHDMCKDFMEVFMDDFSVFRNSFRTCLNNLSKMLARCEETNLVLNWEKCHFMVKEGIVLGHNISKAGIEVDESKVDVIASLPYLTNVKDKLITAPVIIAPNWDLDFELMCDASDYAVGVVLGQRIEKKIRLIYYASKTINNAQEHYTTTEKELLAVLYAFGKFRELHEILEHCYKVPTGGYYGTDITARKIFESGFYWQTIFKDGAKYVQGCDACQRAGNISSRNQMPLTNILVSEVEAEALPTNDARVVVKFLKKIFSRFGVPKALISDRRTHFCNSLLEKTLKKYRVTHRLATPYHPQTSGQTENTNRTIKRIMERTVNENSKEWADKLDDALWAFMTAYKTPIGSTPFRIVYGKACHLTIKLEHKAYWALKNVNLDLDVAGKHRFLQLNQLDEFRSDAYEHSRAYKERTKRWHDSKIMDKEFQE